MMPDRLAAELAEDGFTSTHQKCLDFTRRRVHHSDNYWSQRHERWRECERILRAFRIPDLQDNQTRNDSRTEGVEKIVVPYGYAVLQAALAFCHQTLTQRKPLIPVEGVGPADVQAAMLMESVLAGQSDRMEMPLALVWYQVLLDAFRYGIGITKCLWTLDEFPAVERSTTPILDPFTGQPVSYKDELRTNDVVKYEGNKLMPVSPFDFFPDPRCAYGEFQRGEYCAHHFARSWTEGLQRQAQGLYAGMEHVPKMQSDDFGDGQGLDGVRMSSDLARTLDMSPVERSGLDEYGKPFVDFYEMWAYVEDPDDLGLGDIQPGGSTPRMWVFTMANMARLVRIEPAMLPAMRFPFEVYEPHFDVHSPANHSLIEVFKGLQYYHSWLFNSRMTAVRRTLNNELVYDPDMVEERDILDPEPGRLIRVKREHRGEGRAKESVWPIPVQDTTQGHLENAGYVKGLIQEIMGVPNLLMGMGNTGRRPATETQAVLKSATGRLGLILEIWRKQYGEPLADQMARNTQAFLDLSQPMALRDPYKTALGMPFVQLSPSMLKGEFMFPFLDGGLPTDKQGEAAMLKEIIMAGVQANPQILAMMPWQAIIARFLWAMNWKDLQTFQLSMSNLSVAPPEQVQQQVQAGNLVPLQQPGGPQMRTSQNGSGQGFPIPPYETVPGVGPNGLGTV